MIRRLFFLLLLSLVYGKAICQQYPFENFSTESGLPISPVLSLFQNDDGKLWIGTNNGGIAVYDGYSFEYLTDKNGLPDNIIFDMNKDKEGKILVGTNNGLSVIYNNTVKNYTTNDGFGNNRIMDIFMDKNKQCWLGTDQGVYFMNDTSFVLFDKDSRLNSTAIFSIYQDSKNNFWFCSAMHGLFKYDGKEITNYTTDNGLGHNLVYSIIEIADDIYWVLTHSGVFELSPKGINKVSLGPLGLRDIPCFSILKDKDDAIWISCRNGVLKKEKDKFKLITTKNGLIHNDIWKLFQDKEGNLWLASKTAGISKLSSESFYFYTIQNGLKTNVVTSIYKTLSGDFWIGTANGLAHFIQDTFGVYIDRNGLSDNNIHSISEDKNGILWIGTGDGLNSYDGKNFTSYSSTENVNYNRIHKIFMDKKGEIWLGTKGGLAKLMNGKIQSILNEEIKFDVFDIFQDQKKNYWFATENGLFTYDGATLKHYSEADSITEKRIRSIAQDSTGTLWFSSSTGLYSFRNGKFTNYTTDNGLLSNTIYSLTVDTKGQLWAGTSSGIDKISMSGSKMAKIKHYEPADGFLGQDCHLNSIYTNSADGKIWIGTAKGLFIYQPEMERENKLEPITQINNVLLFSQPTHWSDFADTVINTIPLHLSLPYEKNYLTFQYVGVNLTAPTKIKYQYMLKGLDQDWLPVTDKKEAVYSNIPPGKYEFLVRAANNDEVWNEHPVSFHFEIKPPFWRTWWFYSLCATIVMAGVYSYFKIKTANIKIKAAHQEILQQKNIIEEKNIELENANVEIAKKNKDITDSINYAKRIQEAILPPEKLIKEYIQNSFILYKPKDIVSGDFYWMAHTDDQVLFAIGDCTGHGVPGALMSIVGYNGLNAALKEHKLTLSGEILDQLNLEVEETFSQQEHHEIKDGMDIALCCIDYSKNILHFAGANNPLYIIRKSGVPLKTFSNLILQPAIGHNAFSLYEIKGDRQPIGAFENKQKFVTHSFYLEKGDSLYIFSDGYADQFGGHKGKKFMYSQLKKLLLSMQHQSMESQHQQLNHAFENWKGALEQVDDVCIIGIRI